MRLLPALTRSLHRIPFVRMAYVLVLLFASALRPLAAAAADSTRAATPRLAGYPDFEIVESAPIETSLDHPDIRNAHEVWLEMIRGAEVTLDFAEFYASNEPGGPLEDVIREIERAAERGVQVRFLSEDNFYRTYPETIDRLARTSGIETRLLDLSNRSGGVLHAKYFVADSRDVFLGSQNFDWRALEHIYELGVRIQDKAFGRALTDLFGRDWGLADTRTTPAGNRSRSWGDRELPRPSPRIFSESDSLVFFPVMSPKGWIPDSTLWDEAHIVSLIDGAKSAISVQLLTYRPVSDNEYYPTLEAALRRAAARGVHVRLLVADWCKRKSTIPYIRSLSLVPNIEVRMMTIPEWSGGFIPHARVIHAKYMVVDDDRGWIGTSNWERDYFHASRNVGAIVWNKRIGSILAKVFDDGWSSKYAYAVDPAAEYEPPRISE